MTVGYAPTTLKEAIRNILDYLGGHGPLVLLAMLGIVAGTWGFLEFADYDSDRQQRRFDLSVRRHFNRHPGPPWFTRLNETLTHLGGPVATITACGVTAAYLLIVRKYWAIAVLFCTVTVGAALTVGLKHSLDRVSPGGGPIPSFPSGHAMMSIVVYLSIAATLAEMAERRRTKLLILAVAALIALVVGLTRIVLRIHWATDVFAGWCAGLVWALICWIITQRIEQVRGRRNLPQPVTETA
jgi:undecaprenyl-diphosphatase